MARVKGAHAPSEGHPNGGGLPRSDDHDRRSADAGSQPDERQADARLDRRGPHERTHASFFSGVGGLDLGLERAGWRTVSFSEIDPYASAVLAGRWPGVPNLGDIVQLNRRELEA